MDRKGLVEKTKIVSLGKGERGEETEMVMEREGDRRGRGGEIFGIQV